MIGVLVERAIVERLADAVTVGIVVAWLPRAAVAGVAPAVAIGVRLCRIVRVDAEIAPRTDAARDAVAVVIRAGRQDERRAFGGLAAIVPAGEHRVEARLREHARLAVVRRAQDRHLDVADVDPVADVRHRDVEAVARRIAEQRCHTRTRELVASDVSVAAGAGGLRRLDAEQNVVHVEADGVGAEAIAAIGVNDLEDDRRTATLRIRRRRRERKKSGESDHGRDGACSDGGTGRGRSTGRGEHGSDGTKQHGGDNYQLHRLQGQNRFRS